MSLGREGGRGGGESGGRRRKEGIEGRNYIRSYLSEYNTLLFTDSESGWCHDLSVDGVLRGGEEGGGGVA